MVLVIVIVLVIICEVMKLLVLLNISVELCCMWLLKCVLVLFLMIKVLLCMLFMLLGRVLVVKLLVLLLIISVLLFILQLVSSLVLLWMFSVLLFMQVLVQWLVGLLMISVFCFMFQLMWLQCVRFVLFFSSSWLFVLGVMLKNFVSGSSLLLWFMCMCLMFFVVRDSLCRFSCKVGVCFSCKCQLFMRWFF